MIPPVENTQTDESTPEEFTPNILILSGAPTLDELFDRYPEAETLVELLALIAGRWMLSGSDPNEITEMSAVPRGDVSIAASVQEILDTTPGLSDEQRTRLAELLTSGDSEAG